MQNNSFPVEVFDSEERRWIDMRCVFGLNRISIRYPHASSVFNIDLKKGLVLKKTSVDIILTQKNIFLQSFRNWFSISFSKPLFCNRKDVVFHDTENCVKINIGFPFDEPIIIRGINEHIRKVLQ